MSEINPTCSKSSRNSVAAGPSNATFSGASLNSESPAKPGPNNKSQAKRRNNDRPGSIRKYKYSTDDDTDEVTRDLEREYLEGFQDGLKKRLRQRSTVGSSAAKLRSPSVAPATTTSISTPTEISIGLSRSKSAIPLDSAPAENSSIVESDTAESIHSYHGPEPPHHHHQHHEPEEADVDDDDDNDSDEGDNDTGSINSNSSVETFTLRERQDAINTTHPFGIRIWKPAVYKKIRSVQKIAEGDIHSQPGRQVSWLIWFGNVLWTVLFGTVLFFACSLAASFCMAAFWSESSHRYGKLMFKLGTYLFFPFGKYVELAQDENYLDEDEGQGRSIAEYQRWQAGDIEHGRLFFAAEPNHHRTNSSANITIPSPLNDTTVSNKSIASTGNAHRHQASSSTNVSTGVSQLGTTSNKPPHILTRSLEPNYSGAEEEDLLLNHQAGTNRRRFFGRGQWNIGRVLFYFWYWSLIFPLMSLISVICWFCVFSVPMARLSAILSFHLRRHPLALSFRPAKRAFRPLSDESNSPGDASPSDEETRIILCTYRAWGWKYYKYTIDGTNIIIINLMFPVLFVIFDYYILYETLHYDGFIASNAFLFSMSLMSIVPLAYFIGQAVASISAQTSMGMGAAINAFFSTIVEVFLYGVALRQGKGDLVEGSIVGSLFTGVLVLPGLSMCAGAIKRKTQRYNPRSAGVSSTMLVFAIIGAFAPTIFYQIFGAYEMICPPCFPSENCRQCYFTQVPLEADNFYFSVIQPFGIFCAITLFLSYICGLWFTLRTHAALIWVTGEKEAIGSVPVSAGLQSRKHSVAADAVPGANVGPGVADASVVPVEGGGHDAPNWSRTKSSIILLGATLLYAIIAEILVTTVDVVMKHVSISQKLLGISVFALVPNTTEFLNAISFAMNGNVALSMEIGSAYALQVCLLQIPALVIFSVFYYKPEDVVGPIKDYIFTLIFPRWDLYMALFSVFIFTYVYGEGKSNYFKGSILLLTYFVVMAGFWFADRPYLAESIQLALSQRG